MYGEQRIRLPEGKRAAVAITVDFDAIAAWDGTAHRTSQEYLSRGEFGAEYGVPRLLELLKRHDIKSDWFIPGHSADTFPDACKKIIEHGHTIGVHGYMHEDVADPSCDYDKEAAIMERSLKALKNIGISNPKAYRSPAWNYSSNTLKILKDNGFELDSSLMTSDMYPFRARNVEHLQQADVFEPLSNITVFPPSWYLDDFVEGEFIMGMLTAMKPTNDIFSRWKELYDFAAEKGNACYVLTLHPQTSGRGHMYKLAEKMLTYLKENGAWFTTLEEMSGHLYDPAMKSPVFRRNSL